MRPIGKLYVCLLSGCELARPIECVRFFWRLQRLRRIPLATTFAQCRHEGLASLLPPPHGHRGR
jgi:hypothetical protein